MKSFTDICVHDTRVGATRKTFESAERKLSQIHNRKVKFLCSEKH